MKWTTKNIALCAVLAALALGLSTLEGLFPISLLVPLPGIKLGLANIVTVFALYQLGSGAATSSSFCARVSFALTAYSSRAAAVLSSQCHRAATASGGWLRVYFAPLPPRCAAIRCATSLVMPVYRLPSRQRRI